MTYLWKPKLGCVPNSYEKFMSFSIGDIKLIDSCQFLAESLDSLVKNLHDKSDKYKNFHFMKKEYPEHYEMLCQKGHYPYEWVDSLRKLKHIGLPPIESFYSSLRQEGITAEEYDHAQAVCSTLNCKSFQDYHMAYLNCDVLLLAL